jgi:tetratricopeptide (TPR) repeat protein
VDLETICLKALEKDPDRRYQTAGQMAEDLRRYVNRFAIAARRAGPLRRMRKWVRRQPWLAAGLASALLAVCVAVWFGYQAYMAEERRRIEHDQHEEQLLAEKRRNVIERALVATVSGDFAAAQEYTRQAELLGASPGWVRTLNGVLAMHRGEFHEAVQELKQAVRLMPDSVAAKAMLASLHIYAGQFGRGEALLNEVESLEPVSWEDLLFKGEALGNRDPVRGLQLLDLALGRRESVLGRLIRAFIRGLRAEQTGDLEDAKLAVEDAAVARALIGDKPVAMSVSIYTHVLAASAYERLGDAKKRKEHLGSAARDVAALKPIRDRGRALDLVDPGLYYEYVGQEDAALEEWRRGAGTGNPMVVNCYLAALWGRGEFGKALEACERVAEQTKGTDAEVSRVYVLAELDRARAHRSYQKLIERTSGKNLTFTPCAVYSTIPRLLGNNKGADTFSQELRRSIRLYPPGRAAWSQAVLDYNCGLLSDDRLFAAAGPSRWDQCAAHFQVAFRHLADGQRKVAREHFRAVLAYGGTLNFFELPWSRAFLARMEKDPTWPRWIPVED